MNRLKGKPKVFLISFFFAWFAVISVCLFHVYKATKYELGYGNSPAITITDDQLKFLFISGDVDTIDQDVLPDVEEQKAPFGTNYYKIRNGILYYFHGHDSNVDLEVTHIMHIQNDVRNELTQDEICDFMIRYEGIVPPNTQIEYYKGEKKYILSGEYEGEIVLRHDVPIPLESTNYQEVRDEVEKEERPILIIHMLICLGIFGLFTIPLIALARCEKYLALIICGIIFIILILFCCNLYCDISYSVIGINWHDSFGL